MSLLGRLRRWRARRLHRQADHRLELETSGHRLSRPRLLGASRCGRLRWTARLDDQPVKIVEHHDSEHARFVEAVSTHPRLSAHFPEPLLRQDRFLVVRWVDGEVVDWRDAAVLEAAARLQALLHAETGPPELPAGSFSYLAFLERRWRRYQGVFPFGRTLERLLATLESERPRLPPALSHPDLTAANLVVERSTGRLKAVDNELLGTGPHYPVDLLATYRSFGSRARRGLGPAYLEAYAGGGGKPAALVDDRGWLEALWLLVRIGAALQEGAIAYASQMASDWEAGRHQAPALFEMAAGL